MTLTAEEAEGISFNEEDDEVNDALLTMSLVVRVYTEKPVHRRAFTDRILELWQPVGEVQVKALVGGLFIFTFSVSEDKKKVIQFAPWFYDKAFVLLEEPDGDMAPSLMQLKHVDLWVQCHNLPFKKMSKRMGGAIGNKLGTLLEVDCDETGACVGKFMRVKVRLDISKPLCRGFPIDLASGKKALVEFRYERRFGLCFGCGRIGHKISKCSFISELQKQSKDPPYGLFMFVKREELKIPGHSLQNVDFGVSDDDDGEDQGQEDTAASQPQTHSRALKDRVWVQPPPIVTRNHSPTVGPNIHREVGKEVRKEVRDNTSFLSVKNPSMKQIKVGTNGIKDVSNPVLNHQNIQTPSATALVQEESPKVRILVANQKPLEAGPLKEKTLFGDFEVVVQRGSGSSSLPSSLGSEDNNGVAMQGRVGDWKRKARAVTSPTTGGSLAVVGGKRPNDNQLMFEKNKCPRLTKNGRVPALSVFPEYSAEDQSTAKVMGPDNLAHHEQ